MFDSAPQPDDESEQLDDSNDQTVVESGSTGRHKSAGKGNPMISKSQRIRDYLEANPGARNIDVVAALSGYGVKVGDVASVKVKQRKQAGKPVAKRRGRPKGSTKSKTKATKVVGDDNTASLDSSTTSIRSARRSRATSPTNDSDAVVGIELLEAAVEFVRLAGGIDKAQEAMALIRRIRAL
ncbi:hypothetical protein Poly51_22410 [Rubripirellula tenax]|uniref:Uncharacterized protein n=1 Tax=Rubripirellula tenax TaxID=2528015 RepID=A0A5C6FCL8_9BACT|nr:hypothetical protein [Rubripirellula tenax]TWU59453.1 hypothetical protein Poly51_22410 [Rubripirellula tenax]